MEEGDTVAGEEGLMEEGSADSMNRETVSGEKEEEDHHKPGRKSSPKRPYLCSDCGWWLARPREVGCPFCVGGAPAPRRRVAGEEQPAMKSKKKEADRPFSNKRLFNVWNVGQSKNSTIPKKQEGATRFVCISDTHNRHDDLSIPNGDVLIHSGDFTLSGSTKEVEDFVKFMDSLPHPHKVVVAGNHDCTFDTEWYDKHYLRYHEEKAEAQRLKDLVTSRFIYLEDSLVEINGITIYGSPWTLTYHDWVFQFDKGEDIRPVWDLIPTGVDVLVTHNPPTGVKRLNLGVGGIDAGCSELKRAVARVKPRVHIFGHVHEGYGLFKSQPTTFINACSVNRAYKAVNKPIVFDLI